MVIRCSSVSRLTRIDWCAVLASVRSSSSLSALTGSGRRRLRPEPAPTARDPAFRGRRAPARRAKPRPDAAAVPAPAAPVPTVIARGRRRRALAAPSARARRSDRRRPRPARAGSCRARSRMSLMRSIANSTSVTASPVTGAPSRNLPIRVSAACAKASQARQTEKAAGAFDGVNQPEDVSEDLGVVGLLLETHEFDVDHVETLVGLGQEFTQQVVHCNSLRSAKALAIGPAPGRSVCRGRRLISVATPGSNRVSVNDSLTVRIRDANACSYGR